MFYLSNETMIVIFGSNLTKKSGVTFKIELKKDESNMADGGA